ncbi:MAG: ribonuclease HII [Oscillospiraceae bacterium]
MNISNSLISFDNEFRKTHRIICGVDEAGRGCLAGEVFAGAVIFDETTFIEGLNDSKKLSEKKREILFDEIVSKSLSYCVATATVQEIEEINILNASMLAMKRAVEGLSIKPDLVIVDGNKTPNLDVPVESIIKGDGKSFSIAGASILAKVSRDRYMLEMAKKYPQYAFDSNKGYGTKVHYQRLTEFGKCEIHRPSFLKKFYEKL